MSEESNTLDLTENVEINVEEVNEEQKAAEEEAAKKAAEEEAARVAAEEEAARVAAEEEAETKEGVEEVVENLDEIIGGNIEIISCEYKGMLLKEVLPILIDKYNSIENYSYRNVYGIKSIVKVEDKLCAEEYVKYFK